LNGLPGVFGSSVPETFELKRLIQFLLEEAERLRISPDYKISLPEEMHKFFSGLDTLLNGSGKMSSYDFWDRALTLKEKYRQETKMGVSGKEKAITWAVLSGFLGKSRQKIDKGLAKALDKATGLYYTYYTHEAVKFEYLKNRQEKKLSHKGWPCVTVKKFKARPLPLFLEAEVHYLKTEKDIEKIRVLHEALKNSPLYDRELGMYKVNASLTQESLDIGRCTVFSPGWLENESIWLHMEYKYLLELLNSGLYREFFAEFAKAGICFQNAEVYGRSILENSSFIVSSAFPDQRMWGRGCVARLSGSTAEFIEMWVIMTAGAKPFILNDQGALVLKLTPALPRTFFNPDHTFSCLFLGRTKLIYHNEKDIDTFAPAAKISKIDILWQNGERNMVAGPVVDSGFAERIRNQEAAQIDVHF